MRTLHSLAKVEIPAIYKAWCDKFSEVDFYWNGNALFLDKSEVPIDLDALKFFESGLKKKYPKAYKDSSYIPFNLKI